MTDATNAASSVSLSKDKVVTAVAGKSTTFTVSGSAAAQTWTQKTGSTASPTSGT